MPAPGVLLDGRARHGLHLDDVSCLLVDLFGTLVLHDERRVAQGLPATAAVAEQLGWRGARPRFAASWREAFADLDRRSDADDSEYSLQDVVDRFTSIAEAAGEWRRSASLGADERAQLIDTYVGEWQAGVVTIPGVDALVHELSQRYRLAVVTNTHWAPVVDAVLRRIGVLDALDLVARSVDLGRRKPHPAVYAHVVARLGVEPRRCLFVGDVMAADYIGPRAVGMQAVLVDRAGRYARHPLQRLGHRVTDVRELEELL